MTVTVDRAGILRAWRRDSDSVSLRVRGGTAAAMAEAARRAAGSGAAEEPVGPWEPVATGDESVVVYVDYADSEADLTGYLDRLAHELTGAAPGVVVELFRPAHPPVDRPDVEFPCTAVVLSLRLSAQGRAAQAGRRPYDRADVRPDAVDAVVDEALAFCDIPSAQRFVRLNMASLRCDEQEQAALLRSGVRTPDLPVAITSTDWPRRARQVVFSGDGHALFFSGSGEHAEPVDRTLADAVALVERLADRADYGYVLRSPGPTVDSGTLVQWAWGDVPGVLTGQFRWLRRVEGERAYDALPLQLLPSATVDVLGPLSVFSCRDLAGGMTLLTHRDAEAWLAARRPPAEALEAARNELRPILMTAQDVERERPRFAT